MRDKTHIEAVERWARFVKDNPKEKWKPMLNEFIDAQYEMHAKFLERLKKTKNGPEKIKKLYSIKNTEGYRKLLST